MKIFNTQSEYNQFYDRIKRYANQIALGYFHDIGLRQEAVDKALDEVVNQIIKDKNIGELYAKGIIRNSLKQSFRDKKIDSIPKRESDIKIPEDALRVREIIHKGNLPKVRLLAIENPKERRICLDYWQYGLKQDDVAKKNQVSQSYVSQTISKYS